MTRSKTTKMKLNGYLIVLLAGMQYGVFAQQAETMTISLNVKDEKLSVILQKLEEQSGFRFLYNSEQLAGFTQITYKATNSPLQKVLHDLLESRHFNFQQNGKYISIQKIKTAIPETKGNYKKKYTVNGLVKDIKTGEELIGAVIKAGEQTTVVSSANEYGFYSLTLPEGEYTLSISHIGYTEQSIWVRLDKDTKMDLFLEEAHTQLKELVVSSKPKNENIVSAGMGIMKLNMKDINMIPVLFGEKDILKTIQLLPGIKSAGEGNSGFYVRGGAADQNLILLDEAPVYNPSHLMGFFSVFNSDAIKDVTVYKGGMPAQYGGRLSSVEDIRMNNGNNQQYHVSGGIGLISSKLNVEGPLAKDNGSFLLTGRRTYADLFLKLSEDTTVNRNTLYFYDLNAKLNYKLSEKDRLYLSGYFGKDKLGFDGSFGIDWNNITGTLRWNHILNRKLFSNTSLIFSDYNYNIHITNNGQFTVHSEIRDWNLKEELQLYANPKNSIHFGFNTIYHTVTPGVVTASVNSGTNNFSLQNRYSVENALYLSNKWKASEKLNIDYGIRLSSFSILGKGNFYVLDNKKNISDTLHYSSGQHVRTYLNPEPRISASYLLTDQSSVKVSYTHNTQYLHLISNSTTTRPTDKWIPTNNIIKPEIADQVSVGYFRNLNNDMYELSIETYYKWMQNQIDYKDGANVRTNDAIETQLLFGKGKAYGLELLLKKKTGKLTGWVGYTLSRTEKQIEGINRNNWYPSRQDRTHDLSIVGIYELSPKWTISATWVYYTGDAVSFPSGKYPVDDQVVFYYTERNGYRMPAYHRLDLGATCKLAQRKRLSRELAFSLYNAYGRQNAYTIDFQQDPNDPTKTQAVQTSLFRFVPSISYNFKF